MTAGLVVDNGICRLRLEAEEGCAGMRDRLVRFLAPFFQVSNDDAPPHAVIRLAPYATARDDLERDATRPVTFRRSSCPEYNLSGLMGTRSDGIVVAHDRASATGYAVDRRTRRVMFYGSPDNAGSAIHLHDFVRYLALLVCEAQGYILLHASAVTIAERLILVLGDKGAGKTTTMLDLVAGQGARYYSGDKVVASVEGGRLVIRAWPDIPYIGVGSLRSRPKLAAQLGMVLADATGAPLPASLKQLVDPFRFRAVIPHADLTCADDLAAIVLPNVNGALNGAPGMRWIPRAERRQEDLAGLIEWPHAFLTVQWHRLYVEAARRRAVGGGRAVLGALAETPWLALHGKGAPPPILEGCH